MELEFLDIMQTAPAGRRTFVVIEQSRAIAADISFGSDSCKINSSHVLNVAGPVSREQCKETVKEICAALKAFKNLSRNLVISLPPSLFAIKLVSLPKTKNKNINRYIQNKFAPSGDVACKYKILNEYSAGGAEKVSVLVFTIPASIINDVYYFFGRAGFRVKCTSHPLVGVIELLNGSYLNRSRGLTLLVNTEVEPVSLSIFNRDKLEHIRFLTSIDRTSHNDFTESLSLEIKRTILYCKQYYSGATIDNMMYSGPLDSAFHELVEHIYNPADMAVKIVRISNYESKPDCDLGTWLSYYLPGLCGLHMLKRPFSLLPPTRDHFDFSTTHAYARTLATALVLMVLLVSFLSISLINSFSGQRDCVVSMLDGIAAEKVNLNDLGSSEERLTAIDAYQKKTKSFLSVIDSGDRRLTLPIFTIIGSLPETSEVTALGVSMDGASSPAERTFRVQIRDNFTGQSSGALKSCAEQIRESCLFGNVSYRILESVLAETPFLSREEALVEATQ